MVRLIQSRDANQVRMIGRAAARIEGRGIVISPGVSRRRDNDRSRIEGFRTGRCPPQDRPSWFPN